MKLSVFLITYNEEVRLPATLEAAQRVADEIVIVDSGSTDRTMEIARSFGASVIDQPFLGYGGQKRLGEDHCSHDWVLNLDADEVLTDALIKEIKVLKASKPAQTVGYKVHILNIYPGADKPRPFANDYNEIRLYSRNAIRYRDHPIYDRVEVTSDDRIGQLKAPIHHFPYVSFAQYIDKQRRLTSHQADNMKQKAIPVLLVRLLVEFPVTFVKFYLLRGHIMGGWRGLSFSGIVAYFRTVRIAKMLKGHFR